MEKRGKKGREEERGGGERRGKRRGGEEKATTLSLSLLVSHTYWFLEVQLVIKNWDRFDNFHRRHLRIWWHEWSVQTGHGSAGISNIKTKSLVRLRKNISGQN